MWLSLALPCYYFKYHLKKVLFLNNNEIIVIICTYVFVSQANPKDLPYLICFEINRSLAIQFAGARVLPLESKLSCAGKTG